nr:hypothetical protein [Tanacetum cinerariifolium]
MATTTEQQVALDEALVPSTKRLRIGRSNFRLPSDIQSKESTLQVVYDVLRSCPFFKAFLVTADVSKIYIHGDHLERSSTNAQLGKVSALTVLGYLKLRSCGDFITAETLTMHFSSGKISCIKLNTRIKIRATRCITPDLQRDDILFSTIKVVSRHQNTQQYGAVLPIELTNKEIRNTKAYKEYYACATGEAAPKPNASARRKKSGSDTSMTPPTAITTLTTTDAVTPRLTTAAKGKQPAKAKSPSDPSELARTEAQQLKIMLRRSRQETHISQHGGFDTDEGTSSKPGVPDVPFDDSEEEMSWNSLDDEETDTQEQDRHDDEGDEKDEINDGEEDDDDDKDGDKRDDDNDDDEDGIAKIDVHNDTERGRDDNEESEDDEESDDEETTEEESFDPIPKNLEDSEDDGNGEEDQGLRISEEERIHKEEEADELYRDVDINQERGLQVSQDIKDSHVTLTPVHPDGMESIFETASSSVAPLPTPTPTMTPSIITTITTASHPPIPLTPIPSEVLQNLPTFHSVFCFDERLKSLEANFCEYRQTNPFAEAVSNIPSIVHQYMNQQLNKAVRVAVQIQTDRLRDSYQRENNEFLRFIDDNMKRIIKESSYSSRTLYAVAADLSEMELKKILIEKMEGNQSIQRSDEQRNLYKTLVEAYEADKINLDTYGERVILKKRRDDDDDQGEGSSAGSDRGSKRQREGKEPKSARAEDQPIVQTSQHPEWFSQRKKPPTLDRDWNKTLPTVQGSAQTWISELAKHTDSRSTFNEFLDTPIDFSNFIMNWLGVDTLTPELLAGPTYELMKGTCKSLTELKYHLEEVYKATTDQLDWINLEGQQYPHNLLQPISLLSDNRGRRVIPFAHFINNDLEYIQRGASSRKYTTSVTKTKAANYRNIKWIEDLFYRFAVNRESALDVYSKRRIIAITDIKIVEWRNYKHLDWISVRRDDDKIYKYKEGDFKRLRLQDIEDILLLLVQGKLSNLTIEERFAFNVSLRMFTRSIVIQRRVEDLQLGVESYQ